MEVGESDLVYADYLRFQRLRIELREGEAQDLCDYVRELPGRVIRLAGSSRVGGGGGLGPATASLRDTRQRIARFYPIHPQASVPVAMRAK